MSENFERILDSYFEAFKKEINTNRDLTIDEIIDYTSKSFMEKWKTSFDYTKVKPKEFKSLPINNDILSNTHFHAYIMYIMTLFDTILTGDTFGIESWIIKEREEWEIKGGSCIYFSVLLYALLLDEGLGCKDCMKLVQGFFKHDIREDYPSFYPWNGQHSGLHAWIALEGAVIDIAINQQHPFFDFKNMPCVIGNIPDGLLYMGYEENINTVAYYLEEILKFSKKPLDLWILDHKINALNVMTKYIKSFQEELKEDFDL